MTDKYKEKSTKEKITKVEITKIPKTYSFSQWAEKRGKRKSHWAGMLAYLREKRNFKYTLEQWDAIFSSY